jgi:hypothetical protein
MRKGRMGEEQGKVGSSGKIVIVYKNLKKEGN